MFKPSDFLQLLTIWGILTLVLIIFALIVYSASAYKERKRFWRVQLLTVGVTYVLSAFLSLILHLNAVLIVMISLLLMFIIQGDVGIHMGDIFRAEELEKSQEETAEQEEEPERPLEVTMQQDLDRNSQ